MRRTANRRGAAHTSDAAPAGSAGGSSARGANFRKNAARLAAAGRRRTAESRSRIRMSIRGVGMLALGAAFAVLGVGFATPILVYVGVGAVSAVAVSLLWVLATVNSFARSHSRVDRDVTPFPLTAGVPGHISVTIAVTRRGPGARLRQAITEHVDLHEQAAAELTGGAGTKAAVERDRGTLTLRYGLYPLVRGRWPLGPALVHCSDPFGLLSADTPVGQPQQVPVWPAVVDLSGTAGALMGHADRVVLGARTPSPDDASLRDYRDGDDLRRVHWPSTARRGTMLVRSDERAGHRPATVILDPPRDPLALERAITAAASVAVSVLTSGHPVRLVGGGLDPAVMRHLGERGGDAARYELLNHTVDLTSPASRAAGTADLVRAARIVAEDTRQGEVTVAIVEPLDDQALQELVPIGESGRAWAIVRTDDTIDEQARHTVAKLRKAGWRVTTTRADDDLEQLWTRLLSAGDLG